MVATASFVVAASTLFAQAFGAPLPRSEAAPVSSLAERAAYSYRVFGGDGSMSAGWPAEKDWLSFDALWTANQHILSKSCAQYQGSPQDNSDAEIAAIKKAIESGSAKTGVPKQYILAAMMQESKGCVRAPTTNYGVNNPGLMQCFNGKATCNPDNKNFVTPCPDSTINSMIEEGLGIGLEFGIQQALTQSKATDGSKYYKAARIYNSGSVDVSGNLGAGIATHCYASDIANRMLGWTDEASGCQEGTIGSQQGSAGSSGNGNGNGNSNGDTPTPTQGTTPATTPTPTQAPATNGESTPSGPKGQGAVENCTRWYTVKKGDSCISTGIDFATLRQLNTGIDATCSNLWAGSSYCIAA